MEWFDSTANVQYLHPAHIEVGMRWAFEAEKPTGPNGAMQLCTELTPVWNIGIGASGGFSHGSRRLFRLRTGELRTTEDNHRVPVDPEILPENLPPHDSTWITHERFGLHDAKGFTTDREWYEVSRLLEKYETEDGRVYRLLAGKHGVIKVVRWDQGKKFLGPARVTWDGAYDQFAAIVEGRGW